ncbi:undecaprenyl-phosphate glucose phosphotransferase [Flavobacterium sp.]|uniref:undecaprenyl-phosphate glucose phosphotransferase n=1 Tax=Flavobacterium sp. TaxID=239 RepID=UPI0025D14BCC|nr:undecaprenyl-phosphate glucose phosphotransferase [Flavobacterium sp.]
MVAQQTGRYSKYIRPINIVFDLIVVTSLSLYFFRELNLNQFYYLLYQTFIWILIAILVKYYEVYRFTTPVEIITKLVKQFIFFLLVVIAFFPFAKTVIFSGKAVAIFITSSFCIIVTFKYFLFFYLKKYRIVTGSNFRNAIIIGYTPEAIRLKEVFDTRKDYGYRFLGFFSDKKQNPEVKGKIEDIKEYVIANKVDEIYCSLNEISNDILKELVEFVDANAKVIKFIPDTKEIYSKNLRLDYYELFPVLSLQKTQLHHPFIKGIKRGFDIIFSLFIIIFFLSWLIPLLALLIKLESKGPVFFKQGRPGMDEEEFYCYKFRSMQVNGYTEQEASKNDPRVTRMGKLMRKTSMDELPQFFNVLFGDMSVVGPRPHLWSQNKAYASKIKKYMVRHYVKPGITGLAQVKGFRGEIETEEDMINRIKFDVFYIENWSLIMDIKIIFQTVFNIFKGEDKAY